VDSVDVRQSVYVVVAGLPNHWLKSESKSAHGRPLGVVHLKARASSRLFLHPSECKRSQYLHRSLNGNRLAAAAGGEKRNVMFVTFPTLCMFAEISQGQRPACGLCKSWNITCEYAIPATDQTNGLAFPASSECEQTASLDFMQRPGMNFDFTMPTSQMEYPALPETNTHSDAVPEVRDIMADFHLPPHDLLVELVNIFFDHLSPMFPCFHRQSFQKLVYSGIIQRESPLILYAICCVAARRHPDSSVKRRQSDWYEQAKFAYQLTQRNPDPGLRTIQAALLLIFHANTAGDFSSSYLFLGKVWGQAVTLGMSKCFCLYYPGDIY
jgi:hypothetical protein